MSTKVLVRLDSSILIFLHEDFSSIISNRNRKTEPKNVKILVFSSDNPD